jgi:hypothetical protein
MPTPLPPERRVQSAVLGSIIFGLLMAGLGSMGMRPGQPLPPWIWVVVAAGGAALAAGALPVKFGRPAWSRWTAIAGLLICAPALILLFAVSVYQGRLNPFTTLLQMGTLGCLRGVAFYASPEIRACFRPPARLPEDAAGT